MRDLTFRALREANAARADEWRDSASGHILHDWSPTDLGCALAGETGELCNLLKKMRRGDDVLLLEVKEELADVVIYADILAQRLGLDLAKAVADKFNYTSKKVGAKTMLPAQEGGDQ